MSNEEIEPHKNASCVLTRKTDGIVSEKQIKNYLDNSRDRAVSCENCTALCYHVKPCAYVYLCGALCVKKRLVMLR